MSAKQIYDPPGDSAPRQTVTAVRRVIREEPQLWLQRDSRNRWFCPHCGETINSIVLPPGTTLGLLPELPKQIVEHLLACSAVQAGLPALKRLRGNDAATSGLHQAMHDASLRMRHTLRRPPSLKGYEIGCLFRPMEAVGGDFYEFLVLPDGRLGLGIGDASGHGVEACMLAAVTKKLLAIYGRSGQSPQECLSAINREIYEDVMQGVFISAEYAILDPVGKLLTYSRAGHPPPIIYNPQRDPQVLHLNANGLALGVDRDRRFDLAIEERTVTLETGDLLILYTDGLIEVKKSDSADLGIEGFVNLLRKYYDRPIDDMLGQIWYNVEKHFISTGQPDDITMVALKAIL